MDLYWCLTIVTVAFFIYLGFSDYCRYKQPKVFCDCDDDTTPDGLWYEEKSE